MITASNTGQQKRTFPAEVFLNGEWVTSSSAFVSVFDRGFMFGDGIYEVTPFYQGKPFRLQDHLDRLHNCIAEMEIEVDISSLEKIMLEAVSRADFKNEDCAVYIQVTRGVAPRTHYFPKNSEPTILLYAYPVALEGFEVKQADLLVSEDLRWHRCDIKSISLMANVKANNEAYRRNLHENLLVRNGYFTEGSHSSVFFVKNDKLHTHPEGPHILPGITRRVLMEICEKLEIEVVEEAVHIDELVEVDEIFLTGTTTQVLAVKKLVSMDDVIYTASQDGRITRRLQQEFIKMTRNSI